MVQELLDQPEYTPDSGDLGITTEMRGGFEAALLEDNEELAPTAASDQLQAGLDDTPLPELAAGDDTAPVNVPDPTPAAAAPPADAPQPAAGDLPAAPPAEVIQVVPAPAPEPVAAAEPPAPFSLPEEVTFDGTVFKAADLVENFGPELGALALAIGQGVVAHELASGRLISSDAYQQQQQRLTQLEAHVTAERFMSEVSRQAGHDFRALFDESGNNTPEFDAWLKGNNADVQLHFNHGSVAEVAGVVKAYRDARQAQVVQKIDTQSGKEHRRAQELHGGTIKPRPGVAPGAGDAKAAARRGFEAALGED